MKNIKRQYNNSRKFKKDLWNRLDRQWQKDALPPYLWYQTRVFRYVTVVAILVILISSSSTGAYAYASGEVIDGTTLYPIKQHMERIEEKLQFSPKDKAQYYLKIMERREQELEHIRKFRNSEVRTMENINMMGKKLENTKQWFENQEIKDPILKQRIEKKLEQRGKNMPGRSGMMQPPQKMMLIQ